MFFSAVVVVVLISILCAVQANTNEDFTKWFVENGGVISGLEVSYFGEMGRGVSATQDIHSEQQILSIPNALMISQRTLNLSPDPIHKKLAAKFKSSNKEAVLSFLIFETLREGSFFEPYVAILPSYVSSTIQFSPEEIALLEEPRIISQANAQIETARRDFQAFKGFVADIFPEDILTRVTYDVFVWANTIIDSRGQRFRGQIYLAPYADLFNYKAHPSARQSQAGEFYLSHHKLSESGLVILADRSQHAGGQVFEDYGDNDDAIYLQYHGFVTRDNPFRCAAVTAPAISTLSSELKAFMKLLQFNAAPSQCVGMDGGLNRVMLIFITAASFNKDEIAVCENVLKTSGVNEAFNGCGFGSVASSISTYFQEDVPFSDPPTLTERTVTNIRIMMAESQPKWSTSLQSDEDLEYVLSLELSDLDPDPASGEWRKALHKLLAVQYRKHIKAHWQGLDFLYKYSSPPKSRKLQQSSSDAAVSSTVAVDGLVARSHQEYESLEDEKFRNVSLEKTIEEFNQWFLQASPSPSKIKAYVDPVYRIGTLAVEDISAEEEYLGVPSEVIMSADTGYLDPVLGKLLKDLEVKYKRRDDKHELLFHLLHERLVKRETSFYWPYLRLLPVPSEQDLPATWSDEDVLSRLRPSFVLGQVRKYREDTRKIYESLLSIPLIASFFPPSVLTFENYLWATTILDSRSIWWDGKRHLVPMLDFVNCREGPSDPSRVHSTVKKITAPPVREFAVTKAPWAFSKGEQLFENYGQPNYIYFMYHGFSLSPEIGGNSHDCVTFLLTITQEESLNLNKTLAVELAKVLLCFFFLFFRNHNNILCCRDSV